jgi:hypothetical protein
MFADNETAKRQYEIDKKNEKIINEEIKEIARHTKSTEEIIKLTETLRNYRKEIYKLKLMLKNELAEIYQIRENEELTEMEERTNKDKEVIINSGMENYIFDVGTMAIICDISNTNHMYPYTNLIKLLEELEDVWIEEDIFSGEDVKGMEMDFRIVLTKNCIDDLGESRRNRRDSVEYTINNKYLNYRKKGEYYINPVAAEKLSARANDIRKLEEELTNQINSYRTNEVLQYYEKELTYWQEKYLEKSMEINDSEMYLE